MSIFNHLIGFKELPKEHQKNQKKEILNNIITLHKAMGIYDSQMSETVLMSYFNEEVEKKTYAANGFGRYFLVEITRLSNEL